MIDSSLDFSFCATKQLFVLPFVAGAYTRVFGFFTGKCVRMTTLLSWARLGVVSDGNHSEMNFRLLLYEW